MLFAYLLEKISLSRGGLGHLPPRWQRDIIRNLIRGLAQMLGRSWGQARHRATRHSSQLQGCWRWVRTDMMGCESSTTPSISASLWWWWKQSRMNGQYIEILKSLLVYLNWLLVMDIFKFELKKYSVWSSIRKSVKEGIGDSCGYKYKLDFACVTTCYHHLVIIFYM